MVERGGGWTVDVELPPYGVAAPALDGEVGESFRVLKVGRSGSARLCAGPEPTCPVELASQVGAGETVVAIPPLTARGKLTFDVREKKNRHPRIPAKLVLKGAAPDPRFAFTLPALLVTERPDTETFVGGQAGDGLDSTTRGVIAATNRAWMVRAVLEAT